MVAEHPEAPPMTKGWMASTMRVGRDFSDIEDMKSILRVHYV
jgi:hypothetical protein